MSTPNPFVGPMAKTYNERTGGCNILFATQLISLITPHLPPPTPNTPLRILDNASGPLTLTTTLLTTPSITSQHPHCHISAIDLSPTFTTSNREALAANPAWSANHTIQVSEMDSTDLKFPDDTFDLSFTSLGIFAFADPVRAAREIYRTLKPGGSAALTTWKRVGWLPLLHEVEKFVRPGAPETRFEMVEAWVEPGKLERTMREGGFGDVVEGEVLAYAWFRDEEAMAGNFAETLKLMVGSRWGAGEKERMKDGFLEVLGREGGREKWIVVREEDGWVGSEAVAWTALCRK